MGNNLKFALRSLARSKGFVIMVVLSLGFALGVNTTMYTVIDATIHPWTPLKDPERLFQVFMRGDPHQTRASFTERFKAVREAKFYQGIAAWGARGFRMPMQGAGSLVVTGGVVVVTPNFFDVAGVPPKMGRTFTPGETSTDDASAILSWDVWRKLFPGRERVDGATVMIGEQSYAVVGVMPFGMSFPYGTGAWLRLAPSKMDTGEPVVRLGPSTSVEVANAALSVAAAQLTARFGSAEQPLVFQLDGVVPRPERVNEMEKIFAGASVAILLIACSNLANMMLARGLTRRRELALKLALGASRWTLVSQLTLEALILAGAGAGVGLLVASWGNDALRNNLPEAALRAVGALGPVLSWRVYLFAALAAALTSLLFGLAPAWRVSNVDVSEPLKESSGTTTGRVRGGLSPIVMAEVGLCMALLLAAGLQIRDLVRLSQQSLSFDPTGLYQMIASTRAGTTAGDFDQRAVEGVRRVKGVIEASAASSLTAPGGVVVSDFPGRVTRSAMAPYYSVVGTRYLATMRTPLLVGRDFEEGDGVRGAAIVDAATARWLWPHINPIGRSIKLGGLESNATWVPVVGVTGTGDLNVNEHPDERPDNAVIYVISNAAAIRTRSTIVRVSTGVPRAATDAARELRTMLNLPYMPFMLSYDARLEAQANATRQIAGVFALFGAFSLLLASAGLYGVLAYAVSQRMREFAVRSALGAGARQLFELVLRDGLVMIVGGLAVGAVLSTWLVNLMRFWTYGFNVGGAELWLVGAESLLAIAAFIACAIPALRATRANPVDILRAV
jgi:predicted permease